MSLIIELTVNKSNLNNILRSIVTNSDNRLLNKETVDIIAKDLLKIKPRQIIHCYTMTELKKIFNALEKSGMKLALGREIIPNSHNIGLVREIHVSTIDSKSFNQCISRYRYYFVLTSDTQSIVLTYNPEIKSKRQVTVVLDNNEIAHCQILQTQSIEVREFKKSKEVKDDLGTYIIYTVD